MRADAIERDVAVAERLMAGPATARMIASELGVSRDNVHRIVRRLRDCHGMCVESEHIKVRCGRGANSVQYRITLPAGRVCAEPGCGTILRRSNPADRCELHGGGFLELGEADA